MKIINRTLILLLTLILLANAPGAAWAAAETASSSPVLPLSSLTHETKSAPAPAEAALSIPGLKAVLIVGPIDGDGGEVTVAAKNDMELAAQELEANGVTVYRFYTPNNDWGQIQAAAEGAHFLIYRGHGVYSGEMPVPVWVGGLALKDRFVSSDDIRSDLHLAPNAIVMLYGCFTAGSAAGDTVSLSSAEAQRRVAMYSDPFLDNGAGGYYANWFGEVFQGYVRDLFQGMTLGQAYENSSDYTQAERYAHPNHPSLAMWLDKDNWYPPTPQYNNAFAGQAQATLDELFGGQKAPAMEVPQKSVTVMVEAAGPQEQVALAVKNGGGGTFTWKANLTSGPAWISLAQASGNAGQPLIVRIRPGQETGHFLASIRIQAEGPEVLNGDQTVMVQVEVVDQEYGLYLPSLKR